MTYDHLDRIHSAAYDYARAHGADNREAREIARAVESKTRKIAEHVITHTGFTPGRWKP